MDERLIITQRPHSIHILKEHIIFHLPQSSKEVIYACSNQNNYENTKNER